MAASTSDPPRIDTSQYTKNLNERIDELRKEAEEHPGEFVARSADGLREIAYDPDEIALYEKLVAMGIDMETVVIDEVGCGPDMGY